MTLPNTRLAYTTEYEHLERAKDSPRGIRLLMESRDAAHTYRSRLHYARRIDRDKNKEIFKEGDPLFGSSVYDNIVVRIKDDTESRWWVYLEKSDTTVEAVEDLP